MDDIRNNEAEEVARLVGALIGRLSALDETHPSTEMPLAQLRALGALERGPRSMSGLSEDLGISVSAVTQMADRMERTGLVERVSEPDDRRVRLLQLTPQGIAVLRSRRQARVQAAARALARLAPAERRDTVRVLQALFNATDPVARPLPALAEHL